MNSILVHSLYESELKLFHFQSLLKTWLWILQYSQVIFHHFSNHTKAILKSPGMQGIGSIHTLHGCVCQSSEGVNSSECTFTQYLNDEIQWCTGNLQTKFKFQRIHWLIYNVCFYYLVSGIHLHTVAMRSFDTQSSIWK